MVTQLTQVFIWPLVMGLCTLHRFSILVKWFTRRVRFSSPVQTALRCSFPVEKVPAVLWGLSFSQLKSFKKKNFFFERFSLVLWSLFPNPTPPSIVHKNKILPVGFERIFTQLHIYKRIFLKADSSTNFLSFFFSGGKTEAQITCLLIYSISIFWTLTTSQEWHQAWEKQR